MKDSLAEAAGDQCLESACSSTTPPPSRTPPGPQTDSSFLRRRMKPDPLMMVIPEGPSTIRLAHTPASRTEVRRDSKIFIAATGQPYTGPASSIPPTPVATWEVMATPSGTPMANLRQTLSLVDMVQSPTAEAKMVMWNSAYHQAQTQHYYTVPGVGQVVQAAPPQYQTTVSPGMTVPAGMMTVVAAQQPLIAGVPQLPRTAEEAAAAAAAASVKLGLVEGVTRHPAGTRSVHQTWQTTNPPPLSPPQVTTATANAPLSPPPQAPAPMTVAAPLAPMAPAVLHSVHPGPASWPPPPPLMAPQLTTVTAVAAQPSSQPPPPSVQTTVVSGQPGRFVPPPPLAPAPMMLSPKAMMPAPSLPAGSGMNEADLKVLLDMAVASRNQQAVDALLRQAQQAGVSADRFQALLNSAAGASR